MSLKTHPLDASFFAPREDSVFAWLGMAGLAINARGTVVMIDPLLVTVERDGEAFSETGLKFLCDLPIEAHDVPHLDVLAFTHAEDDHCGGRTAHQLEDARRPVFLGPPPVFARLYDLGVSSERVMIARDFEIYRQGSVSITITPALHDHDALKPWKRGDCVGYVVRTPDGAIWHPGDTRLIEDLKLIRDVDVLLFDVAYRVPTHLGPDGSAELAKTCGARMLVAYHYGTMAPPAGDELYRRALLSDPADALPFVRDLDAPLLAPAPGEVLRLPL